VASEKSKGDLEGIPWTQPNLRFPSTGTTGFPPTRGLWFPFERLWPKQKAIGKSQKDRKNAMGGAFAGINKGPTVKMGQKDGLKKGFAGGK